MTKSTEAHTLQHRNQQLLSVLAVQEDYARVARLLKDLCFLAAAGALLGLTLAGLNWPLFTVSNDFEYAWSVTGAALVSGIRVDGVQMTGWSAIALLAYLCVAVALVGLVLLAAADVVTAVKARGHRGALIIQGRPRTACKCLIGIPATAAALIFLLFEPVYHLAVTEAGGAYMQTLSENFSFNLSPSGVGTALMLGCFFTGAYYLCSGVRRTRFWRRHQGGCYLLAIVILILYFWQYGYLHTLFGIDQTTSSFPYPFARAINSYSKFTGGVKGSYNGVFTSLAQALFTSSSTTLNDGILYNAATTVGGMLAGFVLGGLLGYGVALLAVCFRRWGSGVLTVCCILAAFPVVALGPVVNHWFPSNSYAMSLLAKIIVVTILSMAGMTVNAYKGLTVLKPNTLDLMAIYDAGTKDTFLKLRLPNSLPNVFTALKTNSATALMGSFVCEFYSRSKTYGLGMMFNNYWDVARYKSWAYIIAAIVSGLVLYLIVAAVERRCIAWHPSMRRK